MESQLRRQESIEQPKKHVIPPFALPRRNVFLLVKRRFTTELESQPSETDDLTSRSDVT